MNTRTFWKNQPVTFDKKKMVFSRQIQQDLPKLNQTMIQSLEFCELNVNDHVTEIVTFLTKNYHDPSRNYVMQFNDSILKFLVGENNYILGLRLKFNNNLVGIIVGTSQKMQLKENITNCVDISLFCVDRRLHGKMASNKLMTEFYNRMIDKNLKVGIFTTNKEVPTAFARLSVYKRPLNPVKLNMLGYFDGKNIKDKKILEKMIDSYTIIRKLPDYITKIDTNNCMDLLTLYNEYMDKFDVHVKYTENEFKNLLFNNNNVVSTYAIKDKNGKIIDFFSFYKYDCLTKPGVKLGDFYLHTVLSDDITTRRITEYASIAAHLEGIDILYFTNSMELNETLTDVDNNYAFDSHQYVNMFNWELPIMKSEQISRFITVH